MRPLRSLLYIPVSNTRALEKARTLPCDAVILDLEDAVAPEAKDAARAQAVEALRAGFGDRLTVLRVNSLDSRWGAADLQAAVQAGSDAVLAPKVDSAAHLQAYDAALAAAPRPTRLWAMVETPAAILHLGEIAPARGPAGWAASWWG
jgi:citrate lyase subunit beta/citryl-CoA lyase